MVFYYPSNKYLNPDVRLQDRFSHFYSKALVSNSGASPSSIKRPEVNVANFNSFSASLRCGVVHCFFLSALTHVASSLPLTRKSELIVSRAIPVNCWCWKNQRPLRRRQIRTHSPPRVLSLARRGVGALRGERDKGDRNPINRRQDSHVPAEQTRLQNRRTAANKSYPGHLNRLAQTTETLRRHIISCFFPSSVRLLILKQKVRRGCQLGWHGCSASGTGMARGNGVSLYLDTC